jgi:hypothetical protein
MKPERPQFTPGYGITSDAAGTIAWNDTSGKLAASRNYWVATADPDGNPHSTPVWGVWHDDRLYFSTDPASTKGKNIAHKPRAVIHLESGDDVVILHCELSTTTEPETLETVFRTYRDKYSMPDDFVFDPVMCGMPYRGFAWLESDFPNTATRYVR